MSLKSLITRLKGDVESVGIDIGHHSIKVVRCSHSRDSYTLTHLHTEELPEGVFSEGEIRKTDVLAQKINEALEAVGSREVDAQIYASINRSWGVLIDRHKMPAFKSSEEERRIYEEAENHPPFDEKEITIDYSIIKRDESQIDVLLSAVKNPYLERLAGVFSENNWNLMAFDIGCFALYNAYILQAGETAEKEASIIFDVGESTAQVIFVIDGIFDSVRGIDSCSIQKQVSNISRLRNFSMEHSKKLLLGDEDLVKQYPEFRVTQLNEMTKNLQQAIQRFQGENRGSIFKKVYVSGAAANSIIGLREHLKLSLGIDDVNSLELIKLLPGAEYLEFSDVDASAYNVAVGLATRKD
ncbi:pilus assembly protein PilM [bacterium]|nr:pilus assembly protein PilM [bacterium]